MSPQIPNNTDTSSKSSGPHYDPTILLILVIVMLICGAGAIWYTLNLPPEPDPQPIKKVDEFANWKTYTSKVHGFSFSYPSNLYYEEFSDTLLGKERLKLNFYSDSSKLNTKFSIRVNDIFGLEGCDDDPLKEPTVIDGARMTRNNLCGQIFYKKDNKELYIIDWGYEVKDFDQILSTFKFTK